MNNETDNGMVVKTRHPGILTLDPTRVGIALLFIPKEKHVFSVQLTKAEADFLVRPAGEAFMEVEVEQSYIEDLKLMVALKIRREKPGVVPRDSVILSALNFVGVAASVSIDKIKEVLSDRDIPFPPADSSYAYIGRATRKQCEDLGLVLPAIS